MAGLQPGTTTDNQGIGNPRRKVLASAIGAILQEVGFQSADKAAIGTLTEILQSVICEIGRTSNQYAEIAYRTQPVVGDIHLALAELGISTDNLLTYAKRPNRIAITAPGQQMETKQYSVLQVGDKQTHPSHILEHLPAFPDTHTYCFSHTYKQPVTEYEAIREKSAQQKRDIEKALTKFTSKTKEVLNLFLNEDKEFPLVGVECGSHGYQDALMPRDQVFEEDDEYEAKLRKKRKQDEEDTDKKEKEPSEENTNPFLKPVKMPRKVLKRPTAPPTALLRQRDDLLY